MTTTEQREARAIELIEYAKSVPAFTKYDAAEALHCSIEQVKRSIQDVRRSMGVNDAINLAYDAREARYYLVGNLDQAAPHTVRRSRTRESQDVTDLAFAQSMLRTVDPSDPRYLIAAMSVQQHEASLKMAAALRLHESALSA